jgi:hypothetical protein
MLGGYPIVYSLHMQSISKCAYEGLPHHSNYSTTSTELKAITKFITATKHIPGVLTRIGSNLPTPLGDRQIDNIGTRVISRFAKRGKQCFPPALQKILPFGRAELHEERGAEGKTSSPQLSGFHVLPGICRQYSHIERPAPSICRSHCLRMNV